MRLTVLLWIITFKSSHWKLKTIYLVVFFRLKLISSSISQSQMVKVLLLTILELSLKFHFKWICTNRLTRDKYSLFGTGWVTLEASMALYSSSEAKWLHVSLILLATVSLWSWFPACLRLRLQDAIAIVETSLTGSRNDILQTFHYVPGYRVSGIVRRDNCNNKLNDG